MDKEQGAKDTESDIILVIEFNLEKLREGQEKEVQQKQ